MPAIAPTEARLRLALANPLLQLLDKPATDFTRADMIDVIEQKQIERITFHYTAN